mmetsp:Transcript_19425/g.33600  ORF Transcript_19425/g.33600 Transcript_19425/m.33600 type:complete len:305 (-) Transcript_19425:217-1131(-)
MLLTAKHRAVIVTADEIDHGATSAVEEGTGAHIKPTSFEGRHPKRCNSGLQIGVCAHNLGVVEPSADLPPAHGPHLHSKLSDGDLSPHVVYSPHATSTAHHHAASAAHHQSSVIRNAFQEAFFRGRWLLMLLLLQSTSSIVLEANQDLLKGHLWITLYLTMLVGAGGNAGNQSSIKVIRGLATGSIKASWQSARNTIAGQAAVGLLLGLGLGLGGFVRVYLASHSVISSVAISLSLFCIVMTSVVLGSWLPFALCYLGVDPANAGTSIQVLMDILGVGITCVMCRLVLVQLASSLVTHRHHLSL